MASLLGRRVVFRPPASQTFLLKGFVDSAEEANEQRNLSKKEELKTAKQEAPYTISVGRGIKAKVWTNNGSKSTWYNVTFARSYRDENGNYQDADSFGRDDLLYLARAAEKAFDFINSKLQADEE